MTPSVTIREVAKEAGVAISTASMGLRNHPRIPPATRARIQEAAKRIGYRPNPMIAALMANLRAKHPNNTGPVIALLHSHPLPQKRRLSPYYREIVKGASTQAEALGYRIEEFWADAHGMSDHRLSDILRARGIIGVLIAPSEITGRHWELRWDEFAAVSIGYTMKDPQLHRASAQHFQATGLMFEKAIEHGYQRIGLALNEDLDKRVMGYFRAAFLLKQQSLPKKNRFPIFLKSAPDAQSFIAWYKRHQPDIVIGGHEAWTWLQAAGIGVPQECGFILLDWNPQYAHCAGVNQQSQRVSAAAVDLVAEMLQKNERGIPSHPKTILIDSAWKAGDSMRTKS